MAVNVISGSLQTFQLATSGSYTPAAGSDRLLLIFACGRDASTDRTITSITVGGQTATAIGRSTVDVAAYRICGISYLTETQIAALGGGAQTVTITWSGVPASDYWFHVLMLSGVNQTTPVSDTDLNTALTRGTYPTTTKTITLDTNVNEGLLLITGSCPSAGWATLPAGWTTVFNAAVDYDTNAIITLPATGASAGGTLVSTDPSSISLFGVAFAPTSGGAGSPNISDVDTDEIVFDGQTGVVITGTDMGTDNAARVITLRQGSTSVPQTETGSGTATSATITVGMEQSGADIKFGATTLRVTRTGDSSYGDLAITVNPSSGQLFRDVGTPNPTAANRITAVSDISSGDQLHARGVGGGSAPTGLSLNTDGTFEFSNGSTPAAFDVRVWDTSDSTWGAWATQNIDSGIPPDPGARYLVLIGS